MNKITIEQAEAIVGASLAEGWMEAANIMIEKPLPKILKFGTIFENENGKLELTGFSFQGDSSMAQRNCMDAVLARLKESI
jgi:hypothetical protein